jgi:hypothetical protein
MKAGAAAIARNIRAIRKIATRDTAFPNPRATAIKLAQIKKF